MVKEETKKCIGCGADIPSYQRICSYCGREQRFYNFQSSKKLIKEYTSLIDIASAMQRGEDRFYVSGNPLNKNTNNIKNYMTKFVIAIMIFSPIWILILCLKLSIVRSIIFYFSCLAIALLVSLFCFIFNKKYCYLSFNLIGEMGLGFGPNSVFSKYTSKEEKNGSILVYKTWASKNPIKYKIICVLGSLFIFILILLITFLLEIIA